MLQFKRWQLFLIYGLIALGAIFAAPNLVPEATRAALPGYVPKTHVNLGLDLQGGSYLRLSVDTEKVVDDRLAGVRQEIQRAMRPSGGRERVELERPPTVEADGAITLRVRDDADIEEATKRVREITRPAGALSLAAQPYAVNIDGRDISIEITREARRLYAQEALGDSIEVVRRRIDPAGTKEVTIQAQGTDRIIVQVPGDNDPDALKALINRTGQLSFHRHDATVDATDAAAGLLPPGRILLPLSADEGGGSLVLYEEPEVTGDMVETASAGLNTDGAGFQINFSFDSRGARRFGEYTREHVGELFAIVLDGQIISAPRIQSPITGGSGRIVGSFSPEEAANIATLIRSGALPAPLSIEDQRSVGADLGEDSVRQGTTALALGAFAVLLFMIVTYGRFGVFANIALACNVVMLMGFLSLINATLTLPGIAGIVLTIGMAVDANVLIFERIREEIANGKAPIIATELGFDKAFSAIADSNITTFLAALIMLQLGAGPVRGFAVTLAVGVCTSVFCAILVTRLLAGGWLLKKRPAKITL